MSAASARMRRAAAATTEAAAPSQSSSWPRGVSREPRMKIGQVVDALKAEFPALSISKVRYLELFEKPSLLEWI